MSSGTALAVETAGLVKTFGETRPAVSTASAAPLLTGSPP